MRDGDGGVGGVASMHTQTYIYTHTHTHTTTGLRAAISAPEADGDTEDAMALKDASDATVLESRFVLAQP